MISIIPPSGHHPVLTETLPITRMASNILQCRLSPRVHGRGNVPNRFPSLRPGWQLGSARGSARWRVSTEDRVNTWISRKTSLRLHVSLGHRQRMHLGPKVWPILRTPLRPLLWMVSEI